MNAEALLVRLAWALVHFLWQGALLGVVAWGVLALLRRHRPEVRYAAACLFLGGCLALPLLTFLVQGMPAVTPTAEVARTAGYQAVMSLRRLVVGHLPLLLGLWGLGSLILGLRAGASWLWLARLERRATVVMDAQVVSLLEGLQARLGLTRPVRLMASDRVRGPFVQGLWRPIVFVPVGFVTGIDQKALAAILAHELAHVRRLDVLVIGLQTVIETLLYYHPVTWWLSHRVSTEREHCCDAFAVEACGDPVLLAKTLSRFADLLQAGAPALAGGDLMERIQRILNPESGAVRFPAPLLSTGLALSATVLLARQPTLRDMLHRLPSQGQAVMQEVQGGIMAVQATEPVVATRSRDAVQVLPDALEATSPERGGMPVPQEASPVSLPPDPKASGLASVANGLSQLPTGVWLEGGAAMNAARKARRPLVLAVYPAEAQREGILAHLRTLAGLALRQRFEFWLASPTEPGAARILDRHQVRSLPALLVLDAQKNMELQEVRMGGEAEAWGAALGALEGFDELPDAASIRAWAGAEMDPEPFLAFARARHASLGAGATEPHRSWLRGLAGHRSKTVQEWALTRIWEAGALEPFEGRQPTAEYVRLCFERFEKEVLKGNKRHAAIWSDAAPKGLGLIGRVPPEAPVWAGLRQGFRTAQTLVFGPAMYALLAPVLEARDRDWVLKLVQQQAAKEVPRADTQAVYWIAMDWLICFGSPQDWEVFRGALPASWRDSLDSVKSELSRIPAFWGTTEGLRGFLCLQEDPKAFWRNPDPCLEGIGATRENLLMLGLRPLQVAHRPRVRAYPEVARALELSGTLTIGILTDASGKVQAVRPKPGYALWALGPFGIAFASRWTFEPAQMAGEKVPAMFTLTMPFKFDRWGGSDGRWVPVR